jgi:hypothetical protein
MTNNILQILKKQIKYRQKLFSFIKLLIFIVFLFVLLPINFLVYFIWELYQHSSALEYLRFENQA